MDFIKSEREKENLVMYYLGLEFYIDFCFFYSTFTSFNNVENYQLKKIMDSTYYLVEN
jgi:hypothetical protein